MAVQQSVRRETSKVKRFGARALGSPTFPLCSVLPFTVLEGAAFDTVVTRRGEVLLVRRTSLAKKADLSDRFFEFRKGHGTRTALHDQIQDLGIRHPFDTTEIGHDHGHGPAHTGTATDHDPMI